MVSFWGRFLFLYVILGVVISPGLSFGTVTGLCCWWSEGLQHSRQAFSQSDGCSPSSPSHLFMSVYVISPLWRLGLYTAQSPRSVPRICAFICLSPVLCCASPTVVGHRRFQFWCSGRLVLSGRVLLPPSALFVFFARFVSCLLTFFLPVG